VSNLWDKRKRAEHNAKVLREYGIAAKKPAPKKEKKKVTTCPTCGWADCDFELDAKAEMLWFCPECHTYFREGVTE
jgi:PHP family Zn ribbon phosphoesterase